MAVITPQLSVLFTVHTNAIVVTIRISIGDLIAGVGAATKMFAPAANILVLPLCPRSLRNSIVDIPRFSTAVIVVITTNIFVKIIFLTQSENIVKMLQEQLMRSD